MAKQIKLKPIIWKKDGATYYSDFLGVTLSAYRNEHGKYTARLNSPSKRPEMETSLDTIEEAKRYAEKILLPRELLTYFTGF